MTPTHPGFGGTPRPEGLTVLPDSLSSTPLLDDLGLEDVTVIGNSVGGWIAAEMALLASPRMSGVVLLDAWESMWTVPGRERLRPIVREIQALSFHDPTPFRVDPATLPDAQKVDHGCQRRRPGVYAGSPAMADPRCLADSAASPSPLGAVGRERPDCRAWLWPGLRRAIHGALRGAPGYWAHAADGDSRSRAQENLGLGRTPYEFERA